MTVKVSKGGKHEDKGGQNSAIRGVSAQLLHRIVSVQWWSWQ